MSEIPRQSLMDLALAEAEAAGARGEVPVGAVLVDGSSGAVLARSGNRAVFSSPITSSSLVFTGP